MLINIEFIFSSETMLDLSNKLTQYFSAQKVTLNKKVL